MKKYYERFGYTATIVGEKGGSAFLTVKNPAGAVIKHSEHKTYRTAMQAWYDYCSRHNLKMPNTQDAVVIDINIPEPEEPAPIIKEPIRIIKESAPIISSKIANTMSLTAIIDFNFVNDLNLSLPEWIARINECIKSGEYNPSEIARIRLVPNN